MPNKGTNSDRERKRDSKKKDFDKQGKYSSKHIRLTEEKSKEKPK